MQQLNAAEIDKVSGGMKWEGERQSVNIIDRRGFFSRDGYGDILWRDTVENNWFRLWN